MYVLPAARHRPSNLGVKNGLLTPCPGTPNCVNTQAPAGAHYVPPLPYQGEREAARRVLLKMIEDDPNATLIAETPDYVHAEFQAFVFMDDVEFYFPEDVEVVHFRSASRLGRGDLGANQRRYKAIAAAFSSRL